MGANDDSIAFWNGPAAQRWVAYQEKLDRAIAPFGTAAIAAAKLAAGERVLDVGCGCGATLLAIANAVGPNGSVLGVDVSGPMLERARERTERLGTVRVMLADASATTFPHPFDALCSRFGVMFFADPSAAFANLRSALRPGGRVAFVAWRSLGENPWATVPLEAANRVLGPPQPMPPDAPGPFAFADRARIERVLGTAGFRDATVTALDADVCMAEHGLDEAVEYATHAGPAARRLAEASDAQRAAVTEAVREALAPQVRDGRVTLRGAAWVVTARA